MLVAVAPRARGTAWRCSIFFISLVVHSPLASLRLVGSSGMPGRRRTQGADEVVLKVMRWRTVLSTYHHGAPEEQEEPTVIGVGRGVHRDQGARERHTVKREG